jgi:hypothetical protein
LTCPVCRQERKHKPATITRLKSHICLTCCFEERHKPVTIRCPHCGAERTMKASEAARRATGSCRKCPLYLPGELADTFDAGYVLGAVLGDGSIGRTFNKKTKGVGFRIGLSVTDRACADRFQKHLAACVGRQPRIRSDVSDRKANPSIGMPATRTRQWTAIIDSR